MGAVERDDVVVDPRLKVKGTANLRVCDSSIMPEMINANTNAASIMIGEKCADLIRQDNGLGSGYDQYGTGLETSERPVRPKDKPLLIPIDVEFPSDGEDGYSAANTPDKSRYSNARDRRVRQRYSGY